MTTSLTEGETNAGVVDAPIIEELLVPSDVWDEVVGLYTQGMGVEPDKSQFPPKLIFRPAGQNYELHLIQTEDAELLRQAADSITTFNKVASAGRVWSFWDQATRNGAKPDLPYCQIRIVPALGRPEGMIVTLASVIFPSKQFAPAVFKGGVIHMP